MSKSDDVKAHSKLTVVWLFGLFESLVRYLEKPTNGSPSVDSKRIWGRRISALYGANKCRSNVNCLTQECRLVQIGGFSY